MDFLISNAITIFILAALVFFVYGQFKKKKDAAHKKSLHQQTEQQAKAVGMNMKELIVS